jgi:hypothetical protein
MSVLMINVLFDVATMPAHTQTTVPEVLCKQLRSRASHRTCARAGPRHERRVHADCESY